MVDGLRVITLGCHLLGVNLASFGPLLCVWLDWCSLRTIRSNPDVNADMPAVLERTARRLATASLVGMLAGMLLGIANIGWLYAADRWDYLRAATRLRPRLEWGAAEFLFSFLLLVLYRAWFRPGSRSTGWQRWTHRLMAIAAATNLMYHFPPLFSILSELAPQHGDRVLTSAEFRSWLVHPLIAAKTAHVWGASLAVAGIVLSYLVPSADNECGEDLLVIVRAWGARWCLVGTVLQIPTGLWLLSQLEPVQQFATLGADPWASAQLALSVLATFVALNWMAQAALGQPSRRDIRRILAIVAAIVLLMSATLVRLHELTMPSSDARTTQEQHGSCPRTLILGADPNILP